MRDSFVPVTLKASLGICLLLLVGCATSPPSRYYALSPLVEGKALSGDSCASVGIGPINLPEYVNRTQVVNRATADELLGSQFELWVEPLSESVPRVIAEDLSRLLCTKEIVLFPWAMSRAPDYRVEMEIVRIDGTLGGTVSLEAWWRVSNGGDKKTRIARKASYQEPTTDRSYTALVQAHSRALAALSREIAATLKELGVP
jgi:uncharacterized lipoprotein YmbA